MHLYRQDSALATSVGAFLAAGLHRGDAAVVIATAGHRVAFASELRERGLRPNVLLAEGRLICLDAPATLRALTHDGAVDVGAFRQVLTDLVERLGTSGDDRLARPVLVYGEVVSLLWDSGDVLGAIEVERLGNELTAALPLSIYCAYRAAPGVERTHAEMRRVDAAMRAIRKLHSSVLTSHGQGAPIDHAPAPAPAEAPAPAPASAPAPADDGAHTPHDAQGMARVDEWARAQGHGDERDDEEEEEEEVLASCVLAAANDAPARARRLVAQTLRREGFDGGVVDDATLIASELAANAVLHARTPFRVTLTRRPAPACGPRDSGRRGSGRRGSGRRGSGRCGNERLGARRSGDGGPSGAREASILYVTVRDGQPGDAATRERMVPAPMRGLGLVDAGAARWGMHGGPWGKAVWAELLVPGRGASLPRVPRRE